MPQSNLDEFQITFCLPFVSISQKAVKLMLCGTGQCERGCGAFEGIGFKVFALRTSSYFSPFKEVAF
jgi:hypothetical protein